MKFIDLQPEFVQNTLSGAGRKGTAVECRCPCGCGGRLLIPLRNPLDGGPPDRPEVWGDGLTDRWLRTGEDFNSISFEPSILAWQDKAAGKQHWHGFVKNGEVTT